MNVPATNDMIVFYENAKGSWVYLLELLNEIIKVASNSIITQTCFYSIQIIKKIINLIKSLYTYS